MNKKQLKFIHITKCAGSFIENIGYINGYEWGRFHNEYSQGRKHRAWWHENFINKPEKFKKKYDWFVIVRNPYDRLLSEYYCRWAGIGGKNILHTKEEFNNYLINKIENRYKDGNHYTEQYKYIDKNSKITIIRFENLHEELEKLFKLYNINIDSNTFTKVNSKETFNKSPFFTLKDFNEKLINLINSVYDKDFKLLNYDKIETK